MFFSQGYEPSSQAAGLQTWVGFRSIKILDRRLSKPTSLLVQEHKTQPNHTRLSHLVTHLLASCWPKQVTDLSLRSEKRCMRHPAGSTAGQMRVYTPAERGALLWPTVINGKVLKSTLTIVLLSIVRRWEKASRGRLVLPVWNTPARSDHSPQDG